MNITEALKNICPSTNELCYNRGCGMFHERCVFKINNMEKEFAESIKHVMNVKQEYEYKIQLQLKELKERTGMVPTYINIVDGKVVITLSLE